MRWLFATTTGPAGIGVLKGDVFAYGRQSRSSSMFGCGDCVDARPGTTIVHRAMTVTPSSASFIDSSSIGQAAVTRRANLPPERAERESLSTTVRHRRDGTHAERRR